MKKLLVLTEEEQSVDKDILETELLIIRNNMAMSICKDHELYKLVNNALHNSKLCELMTAHLVYTSLPLFMRQCIENGWSIIPRFYDDEDVCGYLQLGACLDSEEIEDPYVWFSRELMDIEDEQFDYDEAIVKVFIREGTPKDTSIMLLEKVISKLAEEWMILVSGPITTDKPANVCI